MREKKITTSLQQYASFDELSKEDQELVKLAYKHAAQAYAPFSTYHVGAALLLANGKTVGGSNQENASYPAGICAERVALSTASSLYPNVATLKIAIVVKTPDYQSEFACAPCGICRQSINETENRYNQPIEIIFPGEEGSFYKVESIQTLLPLSFSGNNLE